MQKKQQLDPVISEKSLELAGKNRYTFAVDPKLNKKEVEQLLPRLYRVHAQKIHSMTIIGKTKRFRGKMGRKASWKKVIISLKKGEKIPGFIVEVPKKEEESKK